MSVTLPFTFDGKRFVYGKISIPVSGLADVEGCDFKMPTEFAVLLLRGDGNAWRFFEAVASAPVLRTVKENLLLQAVKGTYDWEAIDAYTANVPNGKPKFYRSCFDERAVDITDGKEAVSFMIGLDLEGTVSQLPVNVYCNATQTHIYIDFKKYVMATEEIDEFFKFARKLSSAIQFTSRRRAEKCFSKFFSDRAGSYKLLSKMERDATHRKERENLWKRLEEERVMVFAGGILVYDGFSNVYYVTEDGRVYMLSYGGAKLRDVVYRAVKKGKAPTNINEVTEQFTLRRVASAVSKVKPELTIVIAP